MKKKSTSRLSGMNRRSFIKGSLASSVGTAVGVSINSRKAYSESKPETADAKTLVQMAIVYRGKQVTILRDGKPYAAYAIDRPQAFGPDAAVLIGLRYIGQQGEIGPPAKEAVPVLINAVKLQQFGESFRTALSQALKKIDAEAATKAGIK